MILHEKTEKEFGYTFDTAGTLYVFYCICDYCGIEFTRKKGKIQRGYKTLEKDTCNNKVCLNSKIEEVNIFKYGVKNTSQTAEVKKKIKETNLLRFGTENPNELDIIKEKTKETNLLRYGKHPSQTDKFKDNLREKSLINYGVTASLKADEVKKKISDTCRRKYGVDNWIQSEEFKTQYRSTSLKNYGVDHPLKSDIIKDRIKKTNLEKYGVSCPLLTEKNVQLRIKGCQDKYGVDNVIWLYQGKGYGKTQKEINDWLNSFGFDFKSNHSILNGKEIDLYCDNIKFGIEYCGLRFHSEMSIKPKLRNDHFLKYYNAKQKGVYLITLFEDEWKNKNKQCKNFIKAVLGKFERRIYARKCEVHEVNTDDYNLFVNDNHIIGMNKNSKFKCGLFLNNELIGAISLGNHHRQSSKKNVIVLDRMCFKDNVQVVGGASKLFKQCIKWTKDNGYNEIISWSDNRWSTGKIYEILGFQLDAELPPDYSYVMHDKPLVRFSKQSQRKKITNCPEGMTEREWCMECGLARIWDCGKKRWKYQLS